MKDFNQAPKKPCDRCQFFAFSDYMVCAVHPQGPVEGEDCIDFDPWPDGKILWAPVGSGFYEVDATHHYAHHPQRTLLEQLEAIEAHPIFSGHCPQCGTKLGYEPRYLWSCDCGWKDSVNP